ncbi:tRNA (adenosine(37)-N6)-threonylcarbamoyltransferase complex dimerization subunit type 1 TsaB, partial [Dietzia aerolata]|nr:tRNA (adenosine(37)-N6)-threonylcarbamoyltransferase complex dimerization subunit type 1 TsaB [Dietzia aerolata]
MLVLAIDTSTPAVTAGVCRLEPAGPGDAAGSRIETLATRVTEDARAHAELLTPHILECLESASITAAELDAVVVGVGPGPFTGLRVGMATAAAFADAIGVAVHGVCSLDGLAAR